MLVIQISFHRPAWMRRSDVVFASKNQIQSNAGGDMQENTEVISWNTEVADAMIELSNLAVMPVDQEVLVLSLFEIIWFVIIYLKLHCIF